MVGKRHQLEFINILNDDGTLNDKAAPFTGMKRFDARVAVLEQLKQKGLYVETKPNKMVIPICSRTGDIVEPMLKPQWYVNCQEMAKDAIEVVKSGELNISPKSSEKEWFSWMENMQDWCISRQLWWGHTIPAYFIDIAGHTDDRTDGRYWVSGRTKEEALDKAVKKFPDVPKDKIRLEQDPDVLDTWFSAALWPFAIFGWPEKTPDLTHFFPNSLLETGWDILFFWVARMVFFSRKLTGKVPFKDVFCHAMVRDAHGRKMSKSLGNVIDPIDVIEGCTLQQLHASLEAGNLDPREVIKAKEGQKQDFPKGIPECGTDALRFALCAYTSSNRDINLDIARVEGYRKFCNKLWNATKFALMKLGEDFKPAGAAPTLDTVKTLPEKWILNKLNVAITEMNSAMKEFNFMNATSAVYKFWLYELCDVYIEVIKPIIDSGNEENKMSARQTLYTSLDQGLRLLHPFMPFVTEELFQRLPRRPTEPLKTIVLAEFPQPKKGWTGPQAEQDFETVNAAAKAIRSLMTDYNLKNDVTVYISVSDALHPLYTREVDTVATLCFTKNITIKVLKKSEPVPAGCVVSPLNEESAVHLLVRGMVDLDAEISKLQKKLEQTLRFKEGVVKRMNIPNYEEKVPANIRADNEAKLASFDAEMEVIQHGIANFEKLKG